MIFLRMRGPNMWNFGLATEIVKVCGNLTRAHPPPRVLFRCSFLKVICFGGCGTCRTAYLSHLESFHRASQVIAASEPSHLQRVCPSLLMKATLPFLWIRQGATRNLGEYSHAQFCHSCSPNQPMTLILFLSWHPQNHPR